MSIITEQEKQALHYLAHGFSRAAAARAAGFKDAKVFEREHVANAAAQMNANAMTEVKITRDTVALMFLEAHRKSATATEEIAAARELGKLFGLYEPEQVHKKVVNVHVIEEIEHLPTNELLELADMNVHTLDPSEYSIRD